MNTNEIRSKLLDDLKRLRGPEGYLNAGYPRYHTLFGRDSLFSSWQMLKTDPSIAKATLRTLAHHQGKNVNRRREEEPGKILHELRADASSRDELPQWGFPYYGSVDSTPLFIVVATKYFEHTKDEQFLSEIWKSLLKAFEWILEYGDKDADGYIEYSRQNPHGLFHQGWKDGSKDHLNIEPPVAIVEVQGYVYSAYKNLVNLSKKIGRTDIAEIAVARASSLKRNFNNQFWMEEEECFALGLNGKKTPRSVVTSNPGHLLFSGIVDSEKLKPLVARLFQPDMWTPYGVRTHSLADPDFDPYSYHRGSIWPHDNWILHRGLLQQGFSSKAEMIKTALISAFKRLGRIPELYAVEKGKLIDLSTLGTANPLQAWSTCALLEMIGS